jgi:hypothetical protein
MKGYRNKRNVKRKLVYTTLMRRHRLTSITYSAKIKWWGMIYHQSKNVRRKRLMLVCPYTIKLIKGKPTHKGGLNYFHPMDRSDLIKVALTYKTGLRGKVLKRDEWKCKSCEAFLLDSGLPPFALLFTR